MLIVLTISGCGIHGDSRSQGIDGFRDTTIVTKDWRNGLLVHHVVKYDSTSQVIFQNEEVTAFDTVVPALASLDPTLGKTLSVGDYRIYTRSYEQDTFRIMIDSVRTGRFLCLRDTILLKDAHVLEERTVGYGTYRNSGFLVVPDRHDTIRLWSFLDPAMPRTIVWNWEEQVPPTWPEYESHLQALQRLPNGSDFGSFSAMEQPKMATVPFVRTEPFRIRSTSSNSDYPSSAGPGVRCSQWTLTPQEVNEMLTRMTPISGEDWHHLFDHMPCQVVGVIDQSGRSYRFAINAGSWATVSFEDNTLYLGDVKRRFEPYFLASMWDTETER